MKNLHVLSIAVLVLGMVVGQGVSFAQGEAQFPPDRLDQLVAPIALYPDPLLAQIMMASTYPLEVVEADRWVKNNPGLKGDPLQAALKNQTWDPSVSSLTAFPQVLSQMSENLDWTKDLGDAFLAQQSDVMNAVQRMRSKAYGSGNLKSTPEQKVVVEQETIVIESASPEVVYVPAYNPTVVYGAAWVYPTPYYPAVMVPPPGYVASSVVSFGVGVAAGAAMYGAWDWAHHEVYDHHDGHHDGHGGYGDVDIDRNTNINTGDINIGNKGEINKGEFKKGSGGEKGQTWKHNPEHRKGVNYGKDSLNKQYGKTASKSGLSKDSIRGYDQSSAKAGNLPSSKGEQLASRGQQSPGRGQQSPSRGEQRSPTTSARPSQTGGKQDAFSGYGNGKFERQASNRGAASRGAGSSQMSRPSGSSRSAPAMGGGGGGGGSRGGGGGRGGRR